MRLLDDARRLAADMPARGGSGGRCYYCLGHPVGTHEDGCPWDSMPQIVEALEAAERLVTYRWSIPGNAAEGGVAVDTARIVPDSAFHTLAARLHGIRKTP